MYDRTFKLSDGIEEVAPSKLRIETALLFFFHSDMRVSITFVG